MFQMSNNLLDCGYSRERGEKRAFLYRMILIVQRVLKGKDGVYKC